MTTTLRIIMIHYLYLRISSVPSDDLCHWQNINILYAISFAMFAANFSDKYVISVTLVHLFLLINSDNI